MLLPGARGAGAAAGATVPANDTRSLFTALNNPGVAVVELHDSIVLNRSEWGGLAAVNRDVLVTASPERAAASTYVLIDFAGLDVIIGVGRGCKLTFRYIELFNHFWLVGPAFRIIRQSPGATVHMDRCIMRRCAGLPYEAAVVNQITAERPPGFTGPQQCFQVSNFTFRTTDSAEPVTLDRAVRMVDYAAGLLYGGYLHSAAETYYIVDHFVDPACMAVRPGTDCVTLLLQLETLDAWALHRREPCRGLRLQLDAQEQQAAQQQQGGGDGGGGKGAATLAIAIAVPLAVVAAAAALASVLLLRRRRRRRRAAAGSKGDPEAGPGSKAQQGPGDTGCVFLGVEEGQPLPEWSPLAHEQEAEELEVLERTYGRTHADNNGAEAVEVDCQAPDCADGVGGDGAAASTTAGFAAASLLLRPAVTQIGEDGTAGASIAATSDEVTISLPQGCEGPDVAAELAGMAAELRANVQDVAIRLEGILGTGSFGIVYKGTWQGLPVAVKTVVFSASQERRRRALQEAALCQSITHPNIIATYASELQPISSVGTGFSSGGGGGRGGGLPGQGVGSSGEGRFVQDWRLYIVMEYADGGPLGRLFSNKELWLGPERVNLPAILSLALGIARALSHLHSKRIVHGDLNPNNVMLKRDPAEPSGYAVKIGDFGLSVMLPDHRTHLSNLRMGTMFYICPAVVMKGQVGPASDVFALGVMLWELYHGRPAGIRTPEGPRYCSLFPAFPPSCPPAYKEVTLGCLRKHPHKRPTAHEVEAALGALLASLDSSASPRSKDQPRA
ncbi:hypothetical protein HYH03_012565 [Edaphochlamys debaryana]|uniref:Protein kinase domain-containing protein n=1 Tax=Edaphochlamys debaryana TaxID=47281 RepID=A0A835XV78_9CHLO|nr:hypothetical protein HYH03_012565 [Edaphochlamys debaryana]|eukprot:KAG2488946.1 hypothetical protein HYH03_012565 [Edaphochlamys debaryana]